ncbi:MAG: permease-like cell division protein FtsX [Bacillota bacterium]|nr:permease-like cell division protein FtsX [Bacillota bacterium]
MFRNASYSLKQASKQIWRNKVMSVASTFVITAMLFVLGLFFMLTANVNMATEGVKEQFNTVEVFLLDKTSMAESLKMQKSIQAMDEVDSVVYITKDEALLNFKIRFGENSYLLDGLTENPLPNSLRVTLNDLEKGEIVAEVCRTMDGVEDVRYYATEVNKILEITSVLEKVALVIAGLLLITSMIVISNTIKITVESRKDEITIMKYIGATRWFIRGPMLCEGIIIGFISSLIAFGISSALYIKIVDSFATRLMLLASTTLVDAQYMIISLGIIFVVLGISIGAVGSIISMRRYLKA